jgi:hypothetical protein
VALLKDSPCSGLPSRCIQTPALLKWIDSRSAHARRQCGCCLCVFRRERAVVRLNISYRFLDLTFSIVESQFDHWVLGVFFKSAEVRRLESLIMLDPRDWKAVFKVYAREPTLALALAYQFSALKHSLQRGPKGTLDVITALDQAIEHLYPHTDFHRLGRRLFHLTIESTISVKQEDLFTALNDSLQSNNKRNVKTNSMSKRKPQVSLVKSVEKPRVGKKRKLS